MGEQGHQSRSLLWVTSGHGGSLPFAASCNSELLLERTFLYILMIVNSFCIHHMCKYKQYVNKERAPFHLLTSSSSKATTVSRVMAKMEQALPQHTCRPPAYACVEQSVHGSFHGCNIWISYGWAVSLGLFIQIPAVLNGTCVIFWTLVSLSISHGQYC